MLVLSRHASETIRIGDDIVVSVQRISGNRVIIGIDAPQEVAIRRGELAFDGDSIVPTEESAADTASASSSTRGKSKSQKSATNGARNGSGLAARTRANDRRPLIVPMGEPASEWSASHIS